MAAAVAFACVATTGCLVPQSALPVPSATILQVTRDAAQYRSPLPRDVQGARSFEPTRGESCRTMLSWPSNPPTPFVGSAAAASLLPWPSFSVLWGNDGYVKATALALEHAGGGGTLIDVRADVHTTAVLGIWRRECIEVHAVVAR
jgi:hypothetical protein